MNWKFISTLTVILMGLCVGAASYGATANVAVGSGVSNVFVPATTNINVGDRVVWTWGGNFHSTTSGTTSGLNAFPDGLWDSGQHNSGFAFTNNFNAAGTFPYYCSVHFSSGMKGSVVVASVNTPPSVTITGPTNGTILSAPANVTIQASASDTGGSVTNVQFLIGTIVLTNQTVAPFSVATNNLLAGSYTLSAIATDNGALKATNTVNISVVTAVAVTLGSPQWLAPSNFQFNYSANAGLSYVVQRSTNLASSSWTAIVTNTATNATMPFKDSAAPAGQGFYRVGRMPNP